MILNFNGMAIENSGDLPRLVGLAKPGAKIPFDVWRKGRTQTLLVAVGELPGDETAATRSSRSYSRGGLALSELSADQRRELKLDHGLLVESVTGDAARAGIRVGDVILAVNNGKVATVDAFRKAIAGVPKGKSAAILVRRGDGSLYVPLKISGE